MVRVLQIVDCMDLGGIQTFIMNTYREMVCRDIQYDFMIFHATKQFFEDEILALGGKIYKLPSRREGWVKSRRSISKFFDDHPEYKVVHYQTSSLSFLDPLEIAAKKKVPVRIIHSHNTKISGNRLHILFHWINQKRIKKIATDYFACGNLAGKWMFDGSGCEQLVRIINNGIDIAKYGFDKTERAKVRAQLGLSDEFVIGHVGRFFAVKNHRYLIDVFAKYLEIDDNARLMLVGDGELRKSMEQYAKTLNIYEKIMFLGARRDVAQLLQAMDYMIMPSLYEGFPVTAVEAQAAGLPCIISDTITEDAVIQPNVYRKNINEQPEAWAKAIDRHALRITDNKVLIKAGFDVSETMNTLYSIYTRGLRLNAAEL